MRIVHESRLWDMSEGNAFITLTYRDKRECTKDQLEKQLHVPDDFSLVKRHFTLFMKRLRKAFPQTIRFYHVGEYGNVCQHRQNVTDCELCNLGRPHYHAVLFNCQFPDLKRHAENLYGSKILEDLWGYGHVGVGDVNLASAMYIARYCTKKITGLMASDHYMNFDEDGVITFVQPEYATMSRGRPCDYHRQKGQGGDPDCPDCTFGIGNKWYRTYKDEIFPADEIPVPGHGVLNKVPRYYEDILKKEDPATHEAVKAVRQTFRHENFDEYTPERLMDKYKVKKAQVKHLRREL